MSEVVRPRGIWRADHELSDAQVDYAMSKLPTDGLYDGTAFITVHPGGMPNLELRVVWTWERFVIVQKIQREKGYWTTHDDVSGAVLMEEADAQLPEHGGSFSGVTHITEHRFLGRTIGVDWTWTYVRPLEDKKFYDFIVTANEAAGPAGKKVLMDGMELKGVQRVVTEIDANDVNRVTITFIANSINKEPE